MSLFETSTLADLLGPRVTPQPPRDPIRFPDIEAFLKAFQKAFQQVETVEVKRVDHAYIQEVVTRYKPLEFHRATPGMYTEYSAHEVGYLNGKKIIVDKYMSFPRMRPSEEFVRLQHPDLVFQTAQWMDRFFGRDYPVFMTAEHIVMHPHAFDQLTLRFQGMCA